MKKKVEVKLGHEFENLKNKTESVTNSTQFEQKISAIHQQADSTLIDRTFPLPSTNNGNVASVSSTNSNPTFIIKQAGSMDQVLRV